MLVLVLRRSTHPSARCQILTIVLIELSRPFEIFAASTWVAMFGGFYGTICSHAMHQIKGITTNKHPCACGI